MVVNTFVMGKSVKTGSLIYTILQSISPGLVDTELVPLDYKGLPMLQAEDVANAIMYVLSTPPHVQVHELTIKPLGEPF